MKFRVIGGVMCAVSLAVVLFSFRDISQGACMVCLLGAVGYGCGFMISALG